MSHRTDVSSSPLASSEQALKDSIQELQQELNKLSPTAKKHSATRKNYERMIRSTQQLLDEHRSEESARTLTPPSFGRNVLKLLGICGIVFLAMLCILWLT